MASQNTGLIYKATNNITGKSYIGQTSRKLKTRIREHYFRAIKEKRPHPFPRALLKYKRSDWEWSILEDNILYEDLNSREIFWISKFNTFKKGYNASEGGQSTRGYKFSIEARKKMSESRRGKRMHPNAKKALMLACKERIRTKEEIEKSRETRTGQKRSPEQRDKMALSIGGKSFYICDLNWNKIELFHNRILCAEKYNLTHQSIGKCLNKQMSRHKNYRFMFAKE